MGARGLGLKRVWPGPLPRPGPLRDGGGAALCLSSLDLGGRPPGEDHSGGRAAHSLKKLGVKGRRVIGEGGKRHLRIRKEVFSKKEILACLCVCVCARTCRQTHTYGPQVKGCAREGSWRDGVIQAQAVEEAAGPRTRHRQRGVVWGRRKDGSSLSRPGNEAGNAETEVWKNNPPARSPCCASGGQGRMKGLRCTWISCFTRAVCSHITGEIKNGSRVSAPVSSADSAGC